MNVAELMTREPVTIDAEADLDEAVRAMDEQDVRHLPVLDAGRFVGIVSDRDLLEATGWLPRRLREAREGAFAVSKRRTVRELVHAPSMHATPDDDVLALSVESVVQGFGCIPVLEGDRLLGIVTERDMLEAYLDRAKQPREGRREPTVADVMTRPARSIQRTATLGEAREACGSAGIRHLPVLEGDRLVGIVSDRDLRRAIGRGRRDDYPIDELMTARPVTIQPTATVARAAELFVAHRCSALPVVSKDEVVGIVTVEDLIDPCVKALP